MALIPCYECSKEIDYPGEAPSCPHCGAPKTISPATLHKQDPALWEERWGAYLQTGLFKAQPELYWAQGMIRVMEEDGVPMRRVYERERERAALMPRMQGVVLPSYEDLMKMDLSPRPRRR